MHGHVFHKRIDVQYVKDSAPQERYKMTDGRLLSLHQCGHGCTCSHSADHSSSFVCTVIMHLIKRQQSGVYLVQTTIKG